MRRFRPSRRGGRRCRARRSAANAATTSEPPAIATHSENALAPIAMLGTRHRSRSAVTAQTRPSTKRLASPSAHGRRWKGFWPTCMPRFPAIPSSIDKPTMNMSPPLNFRARLAKLERAGTQYFTKRPHQDLEADLAWIVQNAAGWSQRRNDVAHGVVRLLHMVLDPRETLLTAPTEWCLVPPHFRNEPEHGAPRPSSPGPYRLPTKAICCRFFTPAQPDYPAASVRDFLSGAHTQEGRADFGAGDNAAARRN
jgi:hypothetical protein